MKPVTNCKRAFVTGNHNRQKHATTMEAIRKVSVPAHVRNERSVVTWEIYSGRIS